MSDSTVNQVVIELAVGIALLVIASVIITPLVNAPRNKKVKIGIAVIVAASLLVPVLLLREVALKVAETVGQYVTVAERVDIYANLNAILALFWGIGWITRVRPWLFDHLQRRFQNGNEEGEKRNE